MSDWVVRGTTERTKYNNSAVSHIMRCPFTGWGLKWGSVGKPRIMSGPVVLRVAICGSSAWRTSIPISGDDHLGSSWQSWGPTAVLMAYWCMVTLDNSCSTKTKLVHVCGVMNWCLSMGASLFHNQFQSADCLFSTRWWHCIFHSYDVSQNQYTCVQIVLWSEQMLYINKQIVWGWWL